MFLKRLVSFIVLLTLTNCAGKVVKVDPEFLPYVRLFEEQGRLVVDDIIMEFGDPTDGDGSKTNVGVCKIGFTKTPRVIIDPEFWENASNTQREIIVLHELGHCVLERGHDYDKLDGCPMSVMYPYLLSNYCYKSFKKAYLDELFTFGPEDSFSARRDLYRDSTNYSPDCGFVRVEE